jgi:hypothetical protein
MGIKRLSITLNIQREFSIPGASGINGNPTKFEEFEIYYPSILF